MLMEKESQILSEQVSLILKNNIVISFQEQAGDVFDPLRIRLRQGHGIIRSMGADYLLYCLLDLIIDNYFLISGKNSR